MTENFPKINVRHQTTDTGSLEKAPQDKFQKTYIIRCIIYKLQKKKDKIFKESTK